MIRSATIEDLPALIELGRLFHAESGLRDTVVFDQESFSDTATALMSSGFLLVADKGGLCGMAGALIYPMWMNKSHKIAQEMFWYVDKKHRGGMTAGKLFFALEKACRKAGADTMMMMHLESLTPSEVSQMYLKNGYSPVEHNYIKRFN